MIIRLKSILLTLIFISISTGCTPYIITMDMKAVHRSNAPVIITEGAITNKKYTKLAILEISVEKTHKIYADPPKTLVNNLLIEKARILKADAVINVKYEQGMSWSTYGYLNAKGLAIKFTKQEQHANKQLLLQPK